MRSVSVNSGAISFYRSAIWHKYLDHYLTHKVAGRTMKSGDDAMMTRYALLEGEALFQAGCWGYTPHPETLPRLTSQRIRWWRSFYWGNVWLLRTFRPTRFVWWSTIWSFITIAWMTVVVPFVFIARPAVTGDIPWPVLLWAVGLTYVSHARYLTIMRPGEPFRAHLSLWLLAPFTALLNFYTGFVLSYVGLATCLKDGWSSRDNVQATYRADNPSDLPQPPVPARDHDLTAVLPPDASWPSPLPRIDRSRGQLYVTAENSTPANTR
jgi:hyaluronan synthase